MNCARARISRVSATCWPRPKSRCFTSGRQWLQQPYIEPAGHASPSGSGLDGFKVQYYPVSKSPVRQVQPDRQDKRGGVIGLPISERTIDFSTKLLRDICECPACLDPSTKQKLFATPEIPSAVEARSVEVTAAGVKIKWENDIPGWPADHETELSFDILRNIKQLGHIEPPFSPGPQTIWDTEAFSKLPDMAYEAYMQDAAALHQAVHQLHTHGLLFLTNVPESENSVSTIGERIGPIKNTFYGYTWDVRSVPEAKNVAYTSQNLGFHMDLMYMKQPPHIQLLHCIRSSAKGGASTFTDSHRAARDLLELDTAAFETLSKMDVTFHYNHPTTNLYRQKRPVFELHPLECDDKVFGSITEYLGYKKDTQRTRHAKQPHTSHETDIQSLIDNVTWSPPFQGPFALRKRPATSSLDDKMSDGVLNDLNDKVENWHKAAQQFNELIHRPDGVYERMMRPGECVIFDNRRVLHGRKEFEVGDAGTERWLRGAYLDKDPYMSKLQVLSRRFGNL